MKSLTSNAIIMRIREFGESDLLVSFLTPELGMLKGIAKSARRSRKRFVNCLDHFCLVNLEFHLKRENQLYLLDSCKMIDCFEGLRSEYKKLVIASYMVELVEILFPQNVADVRVFELLKTGLTFLSSSEDPDPVKVFFEGRIMALGGYAINFNTCCGCGRKYKGEGRAGFNPSKGRIFCLKCGEISRNCPPLDPESVKQLKKIQEETQDSWDEFVLTPEQLAQIKKVLDCHVAYRLGKRLRSGKYFEP